VKWLTVRTYKLMHLTDDALLADLSSLLARDRENTAAFLACIAEVDARRLYAPAGYSSMYAYCLEALHLSEDATCKRLQASRAAMRFPALFPALADGRLHLTAVCLLAPHLTLANADELIALATHRTRAEIELHLARRYPRAEALRIDDGISPLPQPALGQVATLSGQPALGQVGEVALAQPALGHVAAPAPAPAPAPALRDRIAPLSPERFAVQITIPKSTHDKLRHAQALLGHSLPSGEVAQVLDRALDALIDQLEKRKFAKAKMPRQQARPAAGKRTIPAHVRRAVWDRDGGRCTFVSRSGHRCAAQKPLEFDHVDPVARGGRATVDRIRLRCRAHNQYEAERTFGAGFMQEKRDEARRETTEHLAAEIPGAP